VRAVADAGPIIHLSWIDRLDLLSALFEEVLVPAAVEHEVLRAGLTEPGVAAIRAAFTAGSLLVRPVQDPEAVARLQMATGLDRGESEAIALLHEAGADVLLIDERRARRYAERAALPVTGTIGLLSRSRDRGLIPAVAPVLDDLRQQGFWISPELLERVRREEAR
jgi:predicted nucleic acid-binding protein